MTEHFTGDQKHLDHLLRPLELKIIAAFLPLVPPWLGTAQLTLLTMLWSALIVVFGYLAADNIHWLWGSSACIFMQHVTDMLDGEVGRRRNTGLIKWGFYADHFLDYIFLSSIIIGYAFLLPSSLQYLTLICLVLSAGFMVHTFLDFAVTSDFKISFNRVGVAEARYGVILLNIALIWAGKELFAAVLPWINLGAFIALFCVVYKSQRNYWRTDMDRHYNQQK